MVKEAIKEAYVYRIEYEMNESSWQAYIAAFSQEEATKYLYSNTPGKIARLVNVQQQCRLDSISNSIRDDISVLYKNKINKLKKEIDSLREAKDLRTVPKKKV
jgi:hypothetical protein